MLLCSMLWRKLKVWPLRGRYTMSYSLLTLIFLLNPSCCSLHSFVPQNVSFRHLCHIRLFAHSMVFCVAPFEWLSKSALSVSECRKTLIRIFPWWQVKLGRGGPLLSGHSSCGNLLYVLLPTGYGCVAKCDSLSSRIVDELLTKKVIFLKHYWVFLQDIFYDVTSDLREHSTWVLGQKFEVHFWPILAQDGGGSDNQSTRLFPMRLSLKRSDWQPLLAWCPLNWDTVTMALCSQASNHCLKKICASESSSLFLEIWTKWDSNNFLKLNRKVVWSGKLRWCVTDVL